MHEPPRGEIDWTGRELGDYRVLRRIGSGGMADVYLAEQQSLGRQVALKVLHAQLAGDASYVQRFSNEAKAAASLVHPNIVQIYEVGFDAQAHFIAQEYVPGKNLAQLLERQGALEPGLVLDILRQVVAALCKSHELGIIHRDIKPENILLSHSGEVKVADFGLARVLHSQDKTLTQVGVTMGTPLYMSPEQIEGRPVDVRSDIYSLGATSYHLLTGDPPHRGDTALAIAVKHLQSTPEPLENVRQDLSSSLCRLVHTMLAKQPESRPTSPSELLVALRDLATSAAQEGWAAGPENWSLSEWIATESTRSHASKQLGALMQAESKLAPRKPRVSRLVAVMLAAALAGIVLGAATRPRFYLAGSNGSSVPVRDSAEAQLYHAKISDTPAAWRKVWEEFPDADPFVHQLAKQGLVRHYLLVSEEHRLALVVLRELKQTADADPSLESLAGFTFAAECICYQRLGKTPQAREAQARLTPAMKDNLRRREGQLYQLLQNSVSRMGEEER